MLAVAFNSDPVINRLKSSHLGRGGIDLGDHVASLTIANQQRNGVLQMDVMRRDGGSAVAALFISPMPHGYVLTAGCRGVSVPLGRRSRDECYDDVVMAMADCVPRQA